MGQGQKIIFARYSKEDFNTAIMNFVGENIIESNMAAFEQSEKTEKTVKKVFQENQPFLYAYIFSDSFRFLKEAEKEIFLYLSLLVYKAFTEVNPEGLYRVAYGRFVSKREALNLHNYIRYALKEDAWFLVEK